MDNGIFVLIFWFIINLLIKSAKDKKKIEEARRRRAQQIEKRPIKESKSIIDTIKDEIEREIQRERKGKIPVESKKPKPEPSRKVDIDRGPGWGDEVFEVKRKETKDIEVTKTTSKSERSKMQDDILRGIIFSEILSEPKSVQNLKRSM